MSAPQNVMQAPCWKIRIVIGGAIIHASSATEPAIRISPIGRVESLDWTPIIDGADAGDTLGFIRWEEAIAISWRESTPTESKPDRVTTAEASLALVGEKFTRSSYIEKVKTGLGVRSDKANESFRQLVASGRIKHFTCDTYQKA